MNDLPTFLRLLGLTLNIASAGILWWRQSKTGELTELRLTLLETQQLAANRGDRLIVDGIDVHQERVGRQRRRAANLGWALLLTGFALQAISALLSLRAAN